MVPGWIIMFVFLVLNQVLRKLLSVSLESMGKTLNNQIFEYNSQSTIVNLLLVV